MNFIKKHKIFTFIFISLSLALTGIKTVSAQSPFWANTSSGCLNSGACTLCDMIQVAVNIGVFILQAIGGITLLFFIYGGFIILVSGGSSEKVKKGKDIIINSLIGLSIALLAWLTINLVIFAITGQEFRGDNTGLWAHKLQCK